MTQTSELHSKLLFQFNSSNAFSLQNVCYQTEQARTADSEMLKGEKLTQNSLKETSAILCSLRTEIHGLPKHTSPTENPLQTISPC